MVGMGDLQGKQNGINTVKTKSVMQNINIIS